MTLLLSIRTATVERRMTRSRFMMRGPMQQQFPLALELFLYVSATVIALAMLVLVGVLLHLRAHLGRIVKVVEELEAELLPLAQETRVLVRQMGDISGRVQQQWTHAEQIVGTARSWVGRADRLAELIGSTVEPPLMAASDGVRRLARGLETFVQALLGRTQQNSQKARES
jgi:hypothetical protein